MSGIGVLSSIDFSGVLRNSFDAGTGNPALVVSVTGNLGYQPNNYVTPLTSLNNNGAVTLIAAVGGIVAELQAAARSSPKDTISLVGGTLGNSPNPGGHFKGRISLQSLVTNVHRFTHLQNTFGIQHNEICLLSNTNSSMRAQERGGFAIFRPADIDETKTAQQIAAAYGQAFSQVPAGIKAVIVSADPWFKQTSNMLVQAANGWVTADRARRVCYPLQEYVDDRPASRQTTLHGPSLFEAYRLLGQLAAHTIDPTKPVPAQPLQIVRDV